MSKVQIELPPKLIPLFSTPNIRYRSSWGGRGSAKTRSFALMTAIKGYMYAEAKISGLILGAREYMNSLSDSSMEEIKQAIRSVPFLNQYYEMGENFIRTKNRRVSYGFAGLRHNLDSIKSKARILLCWVDEAETVSEMAWRKLLPTVREDGSEVWITWNPERRDSATSQRFRHEEIFDDLTGELIGVGVEMNYSDNPWFPEVLEIERRQDQKNLDDATYRWIWEGDYLELSEAQIFRNKYKVEAFDDELWKTADRLFFGADFGFANDPNTLIRSFILENTLYIEYEAFGVGVDLDEMAQFYDSVPGARDWPIKGDCSRPETISYLRRQGFNIEAAEKWPGSVEDGIAHIKGFETVVIHTRCKKTLEEFRSYSYKKDRLTDEVLPIIVDKWNHGIDALRYSLDGYIMARGGTGVWSRL
ncbi:PBSX family phage terminase large subunit [Acinetobacter johnsonii]|jgi:phage terminase large subunit|uniref:PBSX family phage terminase large subunit n=1 Tax=Acinetobacter johnsonii TaxID=40214 RepID=UPI0015BA0DDE|nr:phage terminase large subunit [Acinetobacter johnsonii]MDN5621570.1 phage terminase large subunit [Acinetobacter sp.]NWK63755.1 PBSX family phage terminase large subunit [Acinetobacter sp. SwsAc3]